MQRRSASSPSSAGDKINDVGGTIDTKEVDAEAEDWSASAPSGTAKKWPNLGKICIVFGHFWPNPMDLDNLEPSHQSS